MRSRYMGVLARASVALLMLSCVFVEVRAVSTGEADAAYLAEDHARALELYNEVLAVDPDNLRALIRSARLLSWDGRLGSAIERYDRALAVEPGNRHAALGRAVVLSWDGRLASSVAELRALLARDPEDREVRLALARTLSWSGAYAAARAHYDHLLQRDPGDVEAMLGQARAHAWSGNLVIAREWYDRALALDEDNKDAQVGRGYLDLWSGDLDGAWRSAAVLRERFPDDRDVRELNDKVRRACAPSARVQVERTDDTDDNRLDMYRVSVDRALARRWRVEAGAARYDMEDGRSSASIDHAFAAVRFRPTAGQSLSLSAGADRRELSTGETGSDPLGAASYAWGLDRTWQLGIKAAREAVRYSPTITAHGITLDEYEISTTGAPGPRWRLSLHGGGASVSDGNRRVNFLGAGSYRWPASRLVLETGYLFRYLDFDKDLDSGYFDPSAFTAHLLQLRGRGEIGSSKITYRFGLDAGVQSFTRGGVETENDRVIVISGTLAVPMGRGYTLELFGSRGDYAAQNAGGFESRQLGLRFVWRGGR